VGIKVGGDEKKKREGVEWGSIPGNRQSRGCTGWTTSRGDVPKVANKKRGKKNEGGKFTRKLSHQEK